MSRNEAIAVLERDLVSRGKPCELWQALQALKPVARSVKPFVPSPVRANVGLGVKRWSETVEAFQNREYLDTFGEPGSEARKAQEARLASLPRFPQFDHEWMPATKGKLLTLQAVSSMSSTGYVEVEEALPLAA